MAPEETLQKAIEIAQKNWRYRGNMKRDMFQCSPSQTHRGDVRIYNIDDYHVPVDVLFFDRSFREALVGKEFVYPKAMEFSTTWYLRCWHMIYQNPPEITIEMSIADYHLMMCAKSDDRISYVEKVLLSLGNK